MGYRTFWLFAWLLASGSLLAQGQDSTTFERNLQVISTLIAGGFDNANQSYFDFRTGSENTHRRLHVDVGSIAAPQVGEHVFVAATKHIQHGATG